MAVSHEVLELPDATEDIPASLPELPDDTEDIPASLRRACAARGRRSVVLIISFVFERSGKS